LGIDDSDDGYGTGVVMETVDHELDEKNRKAGESRRPPALLLLFPLHRADLRSFLCLSDYPEHIEGTPTPHYSHAIPEESLSQRAVK